MATEQSKLSKTQLIQSFAHLPDDATVEDFIDHLAFILRVERGLSNIEAGRTTSHDELLQRIKLWQG